MTTTTRGIATLLALSVFAPALVATVASAVSAPCCPDCPAPTAPPENAPCSGSLLLVCCEDVATSHEADGTRVDSASARAHFVVAPSRVAPKTARPPSFLQSLAVRHSVVLRI